MSDQSTPQTASVYTAYQGNSYLFGGNAPYVEEMYENYLANPGSVPDNWRDYFDALQHVPAVDGSNAKDVPHCRSSMRSPSAPSRAAPRWWWPAARTPKWAASAPRSSS
jgi:2-oxoglutarate dehydrogenase complex dehydrogenase (E1) component-like enzyme